ncbi:MAG TPA: nuclear transport factor 2 family protein [Chthoniobacterales bacterium]|nr:nuclear transport factor 2 family protein [Chthoniobacterales bacterium]
MKIPSLIALAGMAIGFTGPALAQQKAAGVDPAIIQQLENTISAKYNEAVDKHDAAAIAALYTEDAVFLTATGPLYGQKAIEKFYEDIFTSWNPTDHKSHRDQNSFRMLGSAITSAGLWSETGQGQNGEAIPIKGYWSEINVREGDTWKICQLSGIITPAPAPAQTK